MLIVAHYDKCAPNSIEHCQFLFVRFCFDFVARLAKKTIQIPFLWIYLAEISQKDQILDQINSRYQYFAMFGAMEMCVILQYIALLFIFYIPPV